MNAIVRGATLVVAAWFWTTAALAQDYQPQPGDTVVIYTGKYEPEVFERARQIGHEGFSKAISEAGQTRRTFFIASPETNEIIGISFFKKGHSVDEWHDHSARAEVVKQLDALRTGPVVIRRYELTGSHSTGE